MKNVGFYLVVFGLLFLFLIKKEGWLFVFLFERIWGNVLLLLIVCLMAAYRFDLGFFVGVLFVIMYYSTRFIKGKGMGWVGYEGFRDSPDTDMLKRDFMAFQQTHLPGYYYDWKQLRKQVTPEDIRYLLKNNKWKWSHEVKELYKKYIRENLSVSIDPGIALENAQMVYNEKAILQLMALNSKEGSFLTNGAIVGHTRGVPANRNNLVVCSEKGSGMVKKSWLGYSGIWGNLIENEEPVANEDLPLVVPGFRFVDAPCDPCSEDRSCRFTLNVGDGALISPVWLYLWR